MGRGIIAVGILSLCVLLVGCGGPAANKAVVARQVEEIFNEGKIDLVDELMSPKLEFHNSPPGLTPDREGFKQLVRNHHSAFSDFHCRTEQIVGEGDLVANRWSWTGIHDKGPYLGFGPTGKKIKMTGITIHRFEGGRIVEQWHQVDMLGLLEQFGAAPRLTASP